MACVGPYRPKFRAGLGGDKSILSIQIQYKMSSDRIRLVSYYNHQVSVVLAKIKQNVSVALALLR